VTASFVVVFLRLLLPLTILRWPLGGAFIAILADSADVFILQKFGWGLFDGDRYHVLDKLLDTYYLSLECWVAIHWKESLVRKIAVGLFVLRLGGLIAFETTGNRAFFVMAPNVFENFYVLWLLVQRFGRKAAVTPARIVLLLVIAAVPKMAQEYIMHYQQFPTWEYLRSKLFYWIF
jgi:hypothetical protein